MAEQFTCPICGQTFPTAQAFEQHAEHQHDMSASQAKQAAQRQESEHGIQGQPGKQSTMGQQGISGQPRTSGDQGIAGQPRSSGQQEHGQSGQTRR